jgi:putative tryptophan/tyrosine transport system substrate-binding protein
MITRRRVPILAAGTTLAIALAFTLLADVCAVDAQEPKKVPRIGLLTARARADGGFYIDAFVKGLGELGWVDGKNVVIEYRWAEGKPERLTAFAAELVQLKVDVIFAAATIPVLAARDATKTIPIVVASAGDPVEIGLVESLSRPGRNITGLSYGVGSEVFGKQLELLRETVPTMRRVAVLSNPANPSYAPAIRDVKTAARLMGVQLQLLAVRGPLEFEGAFAAMARERADALLVVSDAILASQRTRLNELVVRSRLPAIYGLREHTEAGGLMSYSADIRDNFRRAAAYVDKILKGAKPADLPIEQPTKFELLINLSTAKALRLTIPPSILLRADQVIE